jgi:Mn-dependent DtxR family transcriptional regulator
LDPITSHQAADSIKQIAPHHMQAIHDCLHEYGPRGKDGIARITKLGPNQVARRLPEMAKMGLVEETGQVVLSDAGRKERQWRGL